MIGNKEGSVCYPSFGQTGGSILIPPPQKIQVVFPTGSAAYEVTISTEAPPRFELEPHLLTKLVAAATYQFGFSSC